MKRVAALAALLALLALPACGSSPGRGSDLDAHVAALEKRLTTTCACHPRKIEGLPIQGEIQADLRRWIQEGKSDREILWLGFTRYGNRLLAAGIADLAARLRLAIYVTVFIALLGLAVLVANLRHAGGGAPPPGGGASPGA